MPPTDYQPFSFAASANRNAAICHGIGFNLSFFVSWSNGRNGQQVFPCQSVSHLHRVSCGIISFGQVDDFDVLGRFVSSSGQRVEIAKPVLIAALAKLSIRSLTLWNVRTSFPIAQSQCKQRFPTTSGKSMSRQKTQRAQKSCPDERRLACRRSSRRSCLGPCSLNHLSGLPPPPGLVACYGRHGRQTPRTACLLLIGRSEGPERQTRCRSSRGGLPGGAAASI
ncbi:hypothetical protein HDK90DRAFT_160039 [Phyllosticta capitalensis]|uniref:Uncharacterized protein n=1 Tax=Phyllosticta capitalensis TaxID=121624 RepID=A0ABR1Z0L5_9PEZI